MENNNIGCLVMAAGNAVRFGQNKLAAEYHGKSLIECALSAVPQELFTKIAVVTQYDAVAALANSFGFTVIRNSCPERGISETIRLGTAFLARCDAIIYMVADQPLLQKSSVREVVRVWKENPDKIVGAACGEKKGNPCIFPQKYFSELLQLQGDSGGKTVIRAHPDAFLPVEIRAQELQDIDTEESLRKLNAKD